MSGERWVKLREVLRRYSPVPAGFVDDLFDMYGSHSASQTEPVIDLDNVAKWLEVPKYRLMDTLRRSYNRNIDFVVRNNAKRVQGRKYGGNSYKEVLISADCFKRLCLRTGSARGEQVRSYFLALEDLMAKHTDEFIHGVEADVQRLEEAQRPRRSIHEGATGYIYVISTGEDALLKLGRTGDLMKRLRTYRTGRTRDVQVLWKYRTDNIAGVEACAKACLRNQQYQKRREVYKAELDEIIGIVQRCDGIATWQLEYKRRSKPTLTGGSTFIVLDDNNTITGADPVAAH